MNDEIRNFCREQYRSAYETYRTTSIQNSTSVRRDGTVIPPNEKRLADIEKASQKYAIKLAAENTTLRYPNEDIAEIWKVIYSKHVESKSGIHDIEVITAVINANQSWIKSSGHAFEELIKEKGTAALQEHGIEIVLQRDLKDMISKGEIANHKTDITWLKERIKESTFDLYAIAKKVHSESNEIKNYCFGCVQSKTSVRDRVTRDREPSIKAMDKFFWSVAFVLDGGFLSMPKFEGMVNGGSAEFQNNGWHGLYVFSNIETNGRIYPTDMALSNFKEHAVRAAAQWFENRQWFNSSWKADEIDDQ